ncbi:hypothetical protein MRX96_045149 [Rhipicephalus microplus]
MTSTNCNEMTHLSTPSCRVERCELWSSPEKVCDSGEAHSTRQGRTGIYILTARGNSSLWFRDSHLNQFRLRRGTLHDNEPSPRTV